MCFEDVFCYILRQKRTELDQLSLQLPFLDESSGKKGIAPEQTDVSPFSPSSCRNCSWRKTGNLGHACSTM